MTIGSGVANVIASGIATGIAHGFSNVLAPFSLGGVTTGGVRSLFVKLYNFILRFL